MLVTKFGPLGASVEFIYEDVKMSGLILQSEISYFRDRRGGQDVLIGESLLGFVTKVREDGKAHVSLRGSIAHRIKDIRSMILSALEGSPDGSIPLGDRSSPEDVSSYFHGVSKSDFKNALGALYREHLIVPGSHETRILEASNSSSSFPPLSSHPHSNKSSSIQIKKVLGKKLDAHLTLTFFVGNLPPSTSHASLLVHLNEALSSIARGTITQLRLKTDDRGNARGFAFFDFLASDEASVNGLAEKIVACVKTSMLGGRKLRCDRDAA